MATTTPNLGLTLPEGTEKVSREIINTNNTLIDTAIGHIGQSSGGVYIYTTSALSISNTSGAYSETFNDSHITADMKAISLEIADDSIFGDEITVTTGDGTVTISCPDVAGSTTMKVSFQKASDVVCDEETLTIATTDWTLSNGVYVYTWQSALVLSISDVVVTAADGAESAGIEEFEYEKVTGGIQFTSAVLPTGNLPVIISIVNAKAEGLNLTGADIATDVISGAENVDEALDALNSKINSKVIVESAGIPEFTAAANSATSVNVEYTKTGYTCFPLQFIDYRTAATWFVHFKSIYNNGVVFDYVNTSSTGYSVSTSSMVWICIKN